MKKKDKSEEEIIDSFERDEWRSVSNLNTAKARFVKTARATILKKKRINLDIPEKDIVHLKAKSFEEGIPFEIFVSSILHKYANGKLVES
ncbi:MAG: antitoxin [Ignavibacteriae bacterium]|nr:antitoxin [Ignavibacteriota bacterium]